MVSDLQRAGLDRVDLSPKQFSAVNKLLKKMCIRAKCISAVLVNSSGLLVSQYGEMKDGDLKILSTLAAADYVASKEMARIIGEEVSFKIHYYEGEKSCLYMTSVEKGFFLVIVFEASTNFEEVRVTTDKTRDKLRKIVAQGYDSKEMAVVEEKLRKDVDSKEFQSELVSRLDKFLLDEE